MIRLLKKVLRGRKLANLVNTGAGADLKRGFSGTWSNPDKTKTLPFILVVCVHTQDKMSFPKEKKRIELRTIAHTERKKKISTKERKKKERKDYLHRKIKKE